jgi:hypothetical protein
MMSVVTFCIWPYFRPQKFKQSDVCFEDPRNPAIEKNAKNELNLLRNSIIESTFFCA